MGTRVRKAMFQAWHWARRDGLNAALRHLEQDQWLSAEELHAMQRQKLGDLLLFAGRHVPYYRALFEQLGMAFDKQLPDEEFQRIPPLTKSTIGSQREALVSEDLAGNSLRSNSTSGSTGEAMRFYTDGRSLPYRRAAELRSDSMAGWRLGDRVARLWGAPMDETQAKQLRGRLHSIMTANLFMSSFDLSPPRMDEYIEKIQEFQPNLLVAYPGPLEQFAIHCRERGVYFPSLKGIVSSAETLWPYQREIIETNFRTSVFDRYGCREVGLIASECDAHSGLHLSVDRVHVEIVNDLGQPCSAGDVGRILVTDLDNYGMPLIRYDIGDRGIASDVACNCGRGLPLLEGVEGRTLEIVRTADGRGIGGTFWTLLLRSRPGIKQFQVVQEKLDEITINFVRGDDFDHESLEYFERKIQEHCGKDFKVAFVAQPSIDVTGSGKRRLIIAKLTDAEDTKEAEAHTVHERI